MITYAILLLPMIRILQKELLDIFQPWYADDGAGMAPIPSLLQFFDHLTVLGPKYGYFLEKSKLILIVESKEMVRAKELSGSYSFDVTTGTRYLGSFIGEKGAQTEWIKGKVEKWAKGLSQFTSLAATHLQQTHVTFTKSFQME